MSDDIDMPGSESFKQLKERLQQEQHGMSKEDVLRESGGIDLDNLPVQKHNFIQRGIVMSCEGAGHPSHRHFLVKRK